jgi:hypothetical protein
VSHIVRTALYSARTRVVVALGVAIAIALVGCRLPAGAATASEAVREYLIAVAKGDANAASTVAVAAVTDSDAAAARLIAFGTREPLRVESVELFEATTDPGDSPSAGTGPRTRAFELVSWVDGGGKNDVTATVVVSAIEQRSTWFVESVNRIDDVAP